jgi:hypothetical protein
MSRQALKAENGLKMTGVSKGQIQISQIEMPAHPTLPKG